MARLRGRAPCGERCRAGVPHGHWKTTTFTGALRLSGMTAPFVYDGAMNGNVFLAYVSQVLVPTLVAMRFNPDLRAKYNRLKAAGKAPKLAITAIMRNLIVLANALLRDGRKWSPTLP